MYLHVWIIIYSVSYIAMCGGTTLYTKHVSNYVSLVSAYQQEGYSVIDVPPLNDLDRSMIVNVDISLYAINGFDEVAGNIELVAALNMTWKDEITNIRSVTFDIDGRESFLVPYDLIWTPKLILTNAIGDASEVGDIAYLCRYNMLTNYVMWKPRVVISGSCTPDVTFYPFDKQQCEFIYTAWGFRSDEIYLETSSDEWDQSDYGLSGEWDIVTTSTEIYEQNSQSFINFKLSILRKPLYFAFNILLPVLVLCLLNATVFLLPAESGERVGFSVTCFLSFVVLLNMIMDIMPRSSSPISFLCYYLVVMMANSGGMTLVTILMMKVYHKPEKSVVPKWLQRCVTFINCGCAKLRCCVLCCRAIRRTCSCRDKRLCGCKDKEFHASEERLTHVSIDSNNGVENPSEKAIHPPERANDNSINRNGFLRCLKGFKKESKTNSEADRDDGCLQEHEKKTVYAGKSCGSTPTIKDSDANSDTSDDDNDNRIDKTSKPTYSKNDSKVAETGHSNCFGYFNKSKIAIAKDDDMDIETELYAAATNKFNNENGTQKRKFNGKEDVDQNETLTKGWVDATQNSVGTKANQLESIEYEQKKSDPTVDSMNDEDTKEKTRSQANKDKKEKPKPTKKKTKVKRSGLDVNKETAAPVINTDAPIIKDDKEPTKPRRDSVKSEIVNTQDRRQSTKADDTSKISIQADTKKQLIKNTKEIDTFYVDPVVVDAESDVDSLADLEEEVEWAEVGRILDTFFFLGFLATQGFFTVVFLVPIFTGNT